MYRGLGRAKNIESLKTKTANEYRILYLIEYQNFLRYNIHKAYEIILWICSFKMILL